MVFLSSSTGSMELPLNTDLLCRRFDGPGVRAIVLMGSYAWGEAGPFSDIDIVRFIEQPQASSDSKKTSASSTYLIDGYLVVVSTADPDQVEAWFSEPEQASATIAGLRQARALLDREGIFAAIQKRAHDFEWDAQMQVRADAWASKQMVGWIEEVHKGLEGLRRMSKNLGPAEEHEAIGRLLQARFGLSWGLSRVMQVQRGVLISGDNAFYHQVAEAVGSDSSWVALRRQAFGIGPSRGDLVSSALVEQIKAGLQLYVVTAKLLEEALLPDDKALVEKTVELIIEVIGESSMPWAG